MTAFASQNRKAMRLRHGRRRRRLVSLVAVVVLVGSGTAVVAPSPASADTSFHHQLSCPPETHPTRFEPRNGPTIPYQAPFNATLNGGQVLVNAPGAALDIELGPVRPGHPTGTLFGNACGLLTLPDLRGPIAADPKVPKPANNPFFNDNFILHGPTDINPGNVPVTDIPIPVDLIVPGTGMAVAGLTGSGSADGPIAARILPAPASNGGFDVTFTTTAKATASIDPTALVGLVGGLGQLISGIDPTLLATLQGLVKNGLPPTGGECTLSFGDQSLTGLPSSEVGNNTTPATLSTTMAGGQPITGPVTAGQGVAVGNNIFQPPISPNMPPDPAAAGAPTPTPSSLCSPTVATLLNTLFGISNGAVADTFVAPVGFAANIPANG